MKAIQVTEFMKVLKPTGTKWEGIAVPLPVLEVEYDGGEKINYTTWRPSWRERIKILLGDYLVVGLCVDRPPPIFVTVKKLEALTGPLAIVDKRKQGQKKRKTKRRYRRPAGKAKNADRD